MQKEDKSRAEDAKRKSFFSIVIPLLNERQSLKELFLRIKSVMGEVEKGYEVIFIDDGSTDGSFEILEELKKDNKEVVAIQFRRNCGKAAALSVGFEQTRGEVIVTMDADLQDAPEEIPNVIQKINEGYDIVSGWKKERKDPIGKRLSSKVFNFVTSLVTGVHLHDINCGLKAYRWEVAKDITLYGELHRYVPVLAYWKGYKVGELAVVHHPRKFGKSKYGVKRFLSGFFDLLTVMMITRYLTKPLHLFGTVGVILTLAGTAINSYLTYHKLTTGSLGGRYPLLMLGILLMIVGIQFVSTGLLAEIVTTSMGKEKYPIRKILE